MTTPSAPHPLKPDGAIRARLGGLLERRFASLGYGKVVAVLIVTTPLLAIYSRRQIVALLVVGAVAMLCVHRFGSPSKPVKWPRIDGKILATAGGYEYEIRLWDVESGKLLHSLPLDDQISSVVFSPDGSLLAVGCFDSNIYLWEIPPSLR